MWHVFFLHDLGDDALVTVAAGHLVTDRELALRGDVNFHRLDDARFRAFTGLGAFHLLVVLHLQIVELLFELPDDLADLVADRRRINLDAVIDHRQLAQQCLRDLAVRRDDDLAGLGVDHVERNLFAEQDVAQRFRQLIAQFVGLLLVIFLDLLGVAFFLAGSGFDRAFAVFFGRDFHVHDDAVGAGGNLERSVLHVRRLFTEDGAEQTFFRRELGFRLRRDLADEDVAGLHFRTDADDAVGREVFQRFIAEVRDVARDLFRPEFRVAGGHFKFINVDAREDVFLHDLLADEDGVLEVVTVPRHERDEHVAAERQFTVIGAGAVGDDLAFLDVIALVNENFLVDARRRIRPHEFADRIDVDAVRRIVLNLLLRLGQLAVFGDDDLAAGDRGHPATFLGNGDRAGIAGHAVFETGRDERRLGDEQRHGLALHVGTHQGAVRIVVFQKRNQRRSDRDELLRRDVHVIHLVRLHVNEVRAGTADHAFGQEVPLVVNQRVRLRDDELFFAIGGQVINVVGHAAVLDLAIRRFKKAEIVDARKGRQ